MSIKEALLKFDRKTEEPYVEVQTAEGKFEKRTLKLGTSDGVNIEVLDGVTLEDKIKIWNEAKKSDVKGVPKNPQRYQNSTCLDVVSYIFKLLKMWSHMFSLSTVALQ